MSYKKTGSIHFVKMGRFGFSFWLKKQKAQRVTVASIRADARANRDSDSEAQFAVGFAASLIVCAIIQTAMVFA